VTFKSDVISVKLSDEADYELGLHAVYSALKHWDEEGCPDGVVDLGDLTVEIEGAGAQIYQAVAILAEFVRERKVRIVLVVGDVRTVLTEPVSY
jgi:hypothetical protein